MSLINDALQRAKAAQQQHAPPPPDHLPLRPVDPQVAVTHGVGVAMPVIFGVIALLLLFFAWRFYMDQHRKSAAPIEVRAQAPAPEISVITAAVAQPTPQAGEPQAAVTTPTPVAAPVQAQAAPLPVQAGTSVPAHAPAPIPTSTLTSNEPAKTAAVVAAAAPAQAAAQPGVTNQPAALAAQPVPTVPPPLKLQGVAYSRTRPSAIVSGKTVFVGDRVRDFRVLAIGAESVTLANASGTNVLVLAD